MGARSSRTILFFRSLQRGRVAGDLGLTLTGTLSRGSTPTGMVLDILPDAGFLRLAGGGGGGAGLGESEGGFLPKQDLERWGAKGRGGGGPLLTGVSVCLGGG